MVGAKTITTAIEILFDIKKKLNKVDTSKYISISVKSTK
jgi:hypothetical protein